MTAERVEVGVVGYNRNPEFPVIGELSDPEFDFRETMYTVYSLFQVESLPGAEWSVGLSFSPLLDHQDLESMTLTVDGKVLHVSDSLEVTDHPSDAPPWTGVVWADPGFRWTDGQRIDAELTMAQPVPALPLAAVALLALLLGVGSSRRVATRN